MWQRSVQKTCVQVEYFVPFRRNQGCQKISSTLGAPNHSLQTVFPAQNTPKHYLSTVAVEKPYDVFKYRLNLQRAQSRVSVLKLLSSHSCYVATQKHASNE